MTLYNFISVVAPNNPFQKELYLLADCEANGPSPLTASMLSTGLVAIDINGHIHGIFYANLKPRAEVGCNQSTMDFWKKFPTAWAQTTYEPLDPQYVMTQMKLWVESLQKKSINAEGQTMTKVVADCGFDWMYLQSYVTKYLDEELILGYDYIHSDTFTWAHTTLSKEITNSLYDHTSQDPYKSDKYPHTHVAVADALCDAYSWFRLMRENQKLSLLADFTYEPEIGAVLAQIASQK